MFDIHPNLQMFYSNQLKVGEFYYLLCVKVECKLDASRKKLKP